MAVAGLGNFFNKIGGVVKRTFANESNPEAGLKSDQGQLDEVFERSHFAPLTQAREQARCVRVLGPTVGRDSLSRAIFLSGQAITGIPGAVLSLGAADGQVKARLIGADKSATPLPVDVEVNQYTGAVKTTLDLGSTGLSVESFSSGYVTVERTGQGGTLVWNFGSDGNEPNEVRAYNHQTGDRVGTHYDDPGFDLSRHRDISNAQATPRLPASVDPARLHHAFESIHAQSFKGYPSAASGALHYALVADEAHPNASCDYINEPITARQVAEVRDNVMKAVSNLLDS